MNVGLYTAIYGSYDRPKILPKLDIPALLYTDNAVLARDAAESGWVGIVSPTPPAATTPMLQAKWWKTHPAIAVPEADISLYVDGSMTILDEDYVQRCLDALGEDDITFVTHPWRDCIYTEADYSATLPRYADADVLAQAAYYRLIGHPERWGLFASGANVRRHTPEVIKHGEFWWEENVNRTWQDQLSLPVITRLMELREGLRWNTNMPWHEWWHLGEHGR